MEQPLNVVCVLPKSVCMLTDGLQIRHKYQSFLFTVFVILLSSYHQIIAIYHTVEEKVRMSSKNHYFCDTVEFFSSDNCCILYSCRESKNVYNHCFIKVCHDMPVYVKANTASKHVFNHCFIKVCHDMSDMLKDV